MAKCSVRLVISSRFIYILAVVLYQEVCIMGAPSVILLF